jgi:hypothetical protein
MIRDIDAPTSQVESAWSCIILARSREGPTRRGIDSPMDRHRRLSEVGRCLSVLGTTLFARSPCLRKPGPSRKMRSRSHSKATRCQAKLDPSLTEPGRTTFGRNCRILRAANPIVPEILNKSEVACSRFRSLYVAAMKSAVICNASRLTIRDWNPSKRVQLRTRERSTDPSTATPNLLRPRRSCGTKVFAPS